jgi:hypothetical protein
MRGAAATAGIAATAALLAAAAPAWAAGPASLGGLLDKLGPAAAATPKGDVAVTGWVESGRDGAELVVRLEPRGAVKIVAEPGITVTPAPRDGVAWAAPELVHEVPDQGYLTPPVELRLPFAAERGGPVEARVDYAYCIVDYQCLFGEATVRAEAVGRGSSLPGS